MKAAKSINKDKASPINGEMKIAAIVSKIMNTLDNISASAAVCIRLFLGVVYLKKKLHAATQHPDKNEPKVRAGSHSPLGGKKKTSEAKAQMTIDTRIRSLAAFMLLMNKKHKRSPAK